MNMIVNISLLTTLVSSVQFAYAGQDGSSGRLVHQAFKGNQEITQSVGVKALPLTIQECEGLGGEVSTTNKCSKKGHKACLTVDSHGVVRAACINEIAAD